jgi:formamidase
MVAAVYRTLLSGAGGQEAFLKSAIHPLTRAPRPPLLPPRYFAPPQWAAPQRFVAAMGMPIRDDGVNEGENLTLACRSALLNMIDLLEARGWSREQAYVICSVFTG